MTNDVATLRLRDAWRECQRNQHYMNQALESLAGLLPFTPEVFGRLTDTEVRALDQFIYRFSKL